MILTVLDVTLRYSTGSGLNVVALVPLVMVGAVYLGLPAAEVDKTHVRTPLLTSRLPARVAAATRLVGLLATIVFICVTIYATFERAAQSLESEEVTTGLERLPVWPSRMMVPALLALLLLPYLNQLPALASSIRGKAEQRHLPDARASQEGAI